MRRSVALALVALGVWLGGMFICRFNHRPLFPPALRFLLTTLELALYDRRMEMRPERDVDPRVVVVTIDQKSEDELGAFPWSRRLHADLIRRLTQDGAAAIGFDVGFGGQRKDDPGADLALAGAVKTSGKVVLALYPKRDSDGTISESFQPLPPDLEKALGEDSKGMVVLLADDDKGFRTSPLHPGSYPSLDVRMLEKLTGQPATFYVPGLSPQPRCDIGPYGAPVWRLPNMIFIDFPGRRPTTISYCDALKSPAGTFRDKLVLIGSILDLNDAYKVPRNGDGRASTSPDFAGVLGHACIQDNLLRGSAITRPEYPLEPASADPWIAGATVGLVLMLGSLAFHHWLRVARALVVSAGLYTAYVVLNFVLFARTGLYLNLALPTAMLAAFTLGVLILDTRRVRGLLGRFVPDAHVEQLLHSPEKLQAAHTTQEATILFVDIRDYTTLSEELGDPARVRELVSRFHHDLGQVFGEYGGYVCDFQGDAQMVAFGVSPKSDDHFRQAVRAAQALPDRVAQLNRELGSTVFRYGVGICTGPVSVGYLQGGGKLQHTVLGDTTNTAARLQSAARDLGVIVVVSHTTADRLREGEFDLRPLAPLPLKGKAEPHRIYQL